MLVILLPAESDKRVFQVEHCDKTFITQESYIYHAQWVISDPRASQVQIRRDFVNSPPDTDNTDNTGEVTFYFYRQVAKFPRLKIRGR